MTEESITMTQDDIHQVLKQKMVEAGYLSAADSEVASWFPVHQKAWESFAFHKLGLVNYTSVPNSQDQLEEAFKSETAVMEPIDLDDTEDGDDTDTDTNPPLVSTTTNAGEGSTDTGSSGTGGSNGTDGRTGSNASDADPESTGAGDGSSEEAAADGTGTAEGNGQ